jgi:uncharacterized protein YndB with AHSA1/START domain
MEDNKKLIIERTFNAPITQVFKAWTDPTILAKWWGPNGVTVPTCDLDVRQGGKLSIVMLAGNELGQLEGQEWPMTGEYKEVSPPYKLIYLSSAIMDGKPIIECLNSIILEQIENKTKMALTVQVTKYTIEAKGPLAGMKQGWIESINKLQSYLDIIA